MSLPSRNAQIEEVAKFLDSDYVEGKTPKGLATEIVDAYLKLMKGAFSFPPPVPRVGLAFKHPSLSGIWYVAHHDSRDNRLWIVSSNTRYGAFLPLKSLFWDHAEESVDNRKDKSKPRPGSPGHNPEYSVGDQLSRNQREFLYEVVATGDKCALLMDKQSHRAIADTNDNLNQYYRREIKVGDMTW